MELAKVVAFITGAGQGLGRATALRLSSMGAKVIVCDMNQTAVNDVVSQIGAANALGAVIDVTNEQQVQTAVNEAIQKFGKISANVNCAGIAIAQRVLGKKGPHSLENFTKVLNVNTIGTFNVLRLTSEKMALNEPDKDGIRGVIINTASVAAIDGQIGQAAYSASKGAVVGMTLPIARDLASSGIRCMCIAPGLFMTPMLAGLPEAARVKLAADVPLPKRLGDPDEYAKLVQSIIENNMLNGEVIRLDGSLRMA